MIKDIIEGQINSGNEILSLSDFEVLANIGETNLVERKTIDKLRTWLDKNQGQKKEKIKEELAKAICAFANYEGGVLLLGAKDNGALEKGISNKHGTHTVRETLSTGISTWLSPGIQNFAVKMVEINNDECLYAVFVGKSRLAPHSSDDIFYSRIEHQTKQIGGVLVRDIFNRNEYADLNIIPKIIDAPPNFPAKIVLSLEIENISNIPAEKVFLAMKLSKKIIISGRHGPLIDVSEDRGQFQIDIIYPRIIHDLTSSFILTDSIKGIWLFDFDEVICNFSLVAKNMLLKEFSYNIKKTNNKFLLTKIK